jgi:hypothetical protein
MDDRKRLVTMLVLLALVATTAMSLRWGAGQALHDSGDLMRRVEEVSLFLKHHDPYSDPDCTYPPSALPIFAAIIRPISNDPRLPWLVINVLAIAAFVAGLVRGGDNRSPRTFAVVALWVASSRPVRAGLALGQFHVLPVALAVWAGIALEAKRPVVAGLLLGLALIKPTMVLPVLLYWMFTGNHRAWLTSTAVQGALTLVASVWLRISPVTLLGEWLGNARGQLAAGSIDLPSLLEHLIPSHALGTSATLVLLVVSGIGATRLARHGAQLATAWSLGMACLFVYHRHYDQVLLLPLIAGICMDSRFDRASRVLALGLGVLLVVPTNPAWAQPLAPFTDAAVACAAYVLIAWTITAGTAQEGGQSQRPISESFVKMHSASMGIRKASVLGTHDGEASRER